eukprot:scaffold27499_cov92-Phaeocystis_antarctica.AAC.2
MSRRSGGLTSAPLRCSHERRVRALAPLSSGRAISGDMAFPQYAGICAATPLITRRRCVAVCSQSTRSVRKYRTPAGSHLGQYAAGAAG